MKSSCNLKTTFNRILLICTVAAAAFEKYNRVADSEIAQAKYWKK